MKLSFFALLLGLFSFGSNPLKVKVKPDYISGKESELIKEEDLAFGEYFL